MGLIELFILAVGLSMDAFAVSVCKGLTMPKISVKKAFIVGAWFGGFQALMPALGYLLGVQFQDKITSIDHWIAFILLGLIGASMIKEAFGEEEPVATVPGQITHVLELTRLYATDEAIRDGIDFYSLSDFSLVICKPDRKVIYSDCQWSGIQETGTLGDMVLEKVTIVAGKRLETEV